MVGGPEWAAAVVAPLILVVLGIGIAIGVAVAVIAFGTWAFL